MACAIVRGEKMSLYDAKEAMGMQHGWSEPGACKVVGDRIVPLTESELLERQIAEEKRRIIGSEEPIFMCGEELDVSTCRCGYYADLLCDYPVGDGKTCDLPCCSRCSVHVADEVDLCTVHAIEHRAGKLRAVKF